MINCKTVFAFDTISFFFFIIFIQYIYYFVQNMFVTLNLSLSFIIIQTQMQTHLQITFEHYWSDQFFTNVKVRTKKNNRNKMLINKSNIETLRPGNGFLDGRQLSLLGYHIVPLVDVLTVWCSRTRLGGLPNNTFCLGCIDFVGTVFYTNICPIDRILSLGIN